MVYGAIFLGVGPMDKSLNVALIGQNALVREGLRRILTEADFTIVGSHDRAAGFDCGTGGDLLVVIDSICATQATDQVSAIRRDNPAAHVVVLVDQFAFDDMAQCFRAGAHGYIVKEISCEPLIASLRLVALGEKVMPSQLADALPDSESHHNGLEVVPLSGTANLSDRESEILRCLVLGYPNKVISRHLRISEATVKVHVKAVLRKLRVQNRTQAAIWGVAHGFESANDDEMVAAERIEVAALARIPTQPSVVRELPVRRIAAAYTPRIAEMPLPVAIDTGWQYAAGLGGTLEDDQLAFISSGFEDQPMFERRPAAAG